MADEVISMAHGGGGNRMRELLDSVILPVLGGKGTDVAEDAAVVELPEGRVAVTTDSFVVKPLFFPGGDIGKLSVCGTVNDLAMMGAKPVALTLGLIIEEGFSIGLLEEIAASAARTAEEAGVKIVAGDTKVVERGKADGIYVNTSGIGVVPKGIEISIRSAVPGDVLLINGFIGDHGIAVMTKREGFNFNVELESDCAHLSGLVSDLVEAGTVHVLRDPTRGGLGAALKEMAVASGCSLEVEEKMLPVREEVRAVCGLLGLDPIFAANEGKVLCAVPESEAEKLLEVMRKHTLGRNAAIVGRVLDGRRGDVRIRTTIGSSRILRMPSGEELPRIC